MTHRLIYVIGPSGAGKDSVLHCLSQTWTDMPPAHWARRTVTRTVQPGGEAHESVSEAAFERLLQEQAFAMAWQANGLRYGVRCTELTPLATGHCVFVNGSRRHLAAVQRGWPQASVVHITAPTEVLHRRLLARRREDGAAIADRLAREVALDLPPEAIRIVNDGPLEAAVLSLRNELRARLTADAASAR
jgi:ribose 1,5-bisphosphokinase